ncbi:MAG: endolytic transglycosylase MltG [Pedobacter sp.]|nr:MAG: endolytic transglycosylase MltG [Pedobacter sp.]
MKSYQKANSPKRKLIVGILVVIGFVAALLAFKFYRVFMAPNTLSEVKVLYIKTGSNIDDVNKSILEEGLLKDFSTFVTASIRMDLAEKIKPGRYEIKPGMNNRTLINKIKSGSQDPVQLKLQNYRKKGNFIAYLAKQLEADSVSLSKVLDSLPLLQEKGFNKDNNYVMYIPNTYQVYWNVKPLDFFERMFKEYQNFWNAEKKSKAKELGLSPIEVGILASIVDAEALFDKEMPTIAGLYLNRLNRGILLQADPTVIFANNDFTVKRVTNALLQVNSPYNTYKNRGLPPGPIMMPSVAALNAVLNREKNNYIYMCAKEDFSGYHNFAETVEQHNINAKKYRDALNKRNIYR